MATLITDVPLRWLRDKVIRRNNYHAKLSGSKMLSLSLA